MMAGHPTHSDISQYPRYCTGGAYPSVTVTKILVQRRRSVTVTKILVQRRRSVTVYKILVPIRGWRVTEFKILVPRHRYVTISNRSVGHPRRWGVTCHTHTHAHTHTHTHTRARARAHEAHICHTHSVTLTSKRNEKFNDIKAGLVCSCG